MIPALLSHHRRNPVTLPTTIVLIAVASLILLLTSPRASFVRIEQDTQATQTTKTSFTPILQPSVKDPKKRTLFEYLDRIRMKCGELCSINSADRVEERKIGNDKGLSWLAVKDVDCEGLKSVEETDDAKDLSFSEIPKELLPYFSMGKSASVIQRQTVRQPSEIQEIVWTEQTIHELVQQASQRTLGGAYGVNSTNYVISRVEKMDINGTSVLVVGSRQTPWVEAICLALGARHVTSMVFENKVESRHAQVSILTGEEMMRRHLSGPRFDAVVSAESIDQLGLGGSWGGEPLNPWGDILAIAKAWCVMKLHGLMFLALPTGKDTVQWSATTSRRTYGNVRWPLVTANWRQLDMIDTNGTERLRDVKEEEPSATYLQGYIFERQSYTVWIPTSGD